MVSVRILRSENILEQEIRTRNDRKVRCPQISLIEVSDYTPQTSVTLEDLGGINDCIQEVLELIVMPLKHPEIYAHTGVQPPRYTLFRRH